MHPQHLPHLSTARRTFPSSSGGSAYARLQVRSACADGDVKVLFMLAMFIDVLWVGLAVFVPLCIMTDVRRALPKISALIAEAARLEALGMEKTTPAVILAFQRPHCAEALPAEMRLAA